MLLLLGSGRGPGRNSLSRRLAAVHGLVRGHYELVKRDAVFWIARGPQTDAHRCKPVLIDTKREFTDRVLDAIAKIGYVLDTGLGDKGDEFITAVACQEIVISELRLYDLANPL